MKQTARLFTDHVGKDTPARSVTGKDAVAFLDRLASINPEYRRDKDAGTLTLRELELHHPKGEGRGLSAATLNKHATCLRVLFDWLVKREELPFDHRNPFAGKSRSTAGDERGYEPMKNSEITTLLGGTTLSRKPSRKFKDQIGWLLALGAFTGARAGELCALGKGDILKQEGVRFIAIPKGKTKNARQVIPLHAKLIEAGIPRIRRRVRGSTFRH